MENLFIKAGQSNYYQYIITILFTLEFCCTHFLNYCINSNINWKWNKNSCNNKSQLFWYWEQDGFVLINWNNKRIKIKWY